MTTELYWLILAALLTGLYWIPYVLQRMTLQGVIGAMQNPSTEAPQPAPWAQRARAAHGIAVENFPIFAALILAAHLSGISNGVTQGAAVVYCLGMLTHYVVFTLGIPYLRTLAFLVGGFGAEMALALTLLGVV